MNFPFAIEPIDRLRLQILPHLSRVPIFPLQDTHLLPQNLHPVDISDPRQRSMAAELARPGDFIAVVTPVPGKEAGGIGSPPVRRVGGAGKVMMRSRQEDGTYRLVVQGVMRVQVEQGLLPQTPYRVTPLPDQVRPGHNPAASLRMLVSMAERVARHLAYKSPNGERVLGSLCRVIHDPGDLADVLTWVMFSRSPLFAQVMQAADLEMRVDLVVTGLARLLMEPSPIAPAAPN